MIHLITNSTKNIIYNLTYLILKKSILFINIIPKITTFQIIYQKIQILSILKCTIHINNKRMC